MVAVHDAAEKLKGAVVQGDVVWVGGDSGRVESDEDVDCGAGLIVIVLRLLCSGLGF